MSYTDYRYNAIHGLGKPELVLYSRVIGGGSTVVVDPLLGDLRIRFYDSPKVNSLRWVSEDNTNSLSRDGELRRRVWGYRLVGSFEFARMDRSQIRKFIKILNLHNDTANYICTLKLHRGWHRPDAAPGYEHDEVAWQVMLEPVFEFRYFDRQIERMLVGFNFQSAKLYSEIPDYYLAESVDADGEDVVVEGRSVFFGGPVEVEDGALVGGGSAAAAAAGAALDS